MYYYFEKEQQYLVGRGRPAAKDKIIIPLTQTIVSLVEVCSLAVIGLIAEINRTSS